MTSPSSASEQPPPELRVTNHALARARQRHADLRLLSERELLKTICREVGAAQREERVAKTAPRETLLEDGQYDRRQKAKWARFAWNASRSRVYVLRRHAGTWLVITVLPTVHSQT